MQSNRRFNFTPQLLVISSLISANPGYEQLGPGQQYKVELVFYSHS